MKNYIIQNKDTRQLSDALSFTFITRAEFYWI
jgi:hypothetical protein